MEQGFGEMMISIFNFAVMGGIALTIFVIVFQGINLLNSRGDPSAFSKTKEKIKNTLIGLGVLLLSYVLLTTINPNIINLEFNIGGVTVKPPTFPTSNPPVEEIETFTFEEIPIGTISEELLAGVSSVEVPCYEYETSFRDGSGNIIIGNTVDQNGDGEIDEKDVLLNKDIFYCMNLLTSAYEAKVEYHLKTLINEMNTSMKNGCKCSRVYIGRLEGQGIITSECGINLGYEKVIMPSSYGKYTPMTCPDAECSACTRAYSFCGQTCGDILGCPTAEPSYGGGIDNPVIETIGEFEQFKYDPCNNRLELICKAAEIQQVIYGGERPRQECYDEGYLKENAPEEPILLTLNEAVQRMEYFKDYFQKKVYQLSCAEQKMKMPWGQRITLAEYEKLKSEISDYNVEKTSFENYDIARYCGEFNSQEEAIGDDSPCKEVEEERQYFYDGDSATFYFSEDYNVYKTNEDSKDKTEKKCTILEGDLTMGEYGGVIPIGEVVDEAEEWGKKVVDRIDNIIAEARMLTDTIIEVVNIPATCNAGRCTTTNAHYGRMTCYSPACGEVGDCYCSNVWPFPCEKGGGIPSAMKPNQYQTIGASCDPKCYSCPISPTPISFYSCGYPIGMPGGCLCGMNVVAVPREQHWVCDYGTFCNVVKKIYWVNDEIDNNSFIETEDEAEEEKRRENLSKIGYLQKFKGFVGALNILSGITISTPTYYGSSVDIISKVCESDLLGPPTSTETPKVEMEYNYSCLGEYQSTPLQMEHTNCPYSYSGPVGAYWCEKQGVYWSCPTNSESCGGSATSGDPNVTDNPVGEVISDDGPEENEEEKVIECPYPYDSLEEAYWCEKQGVYWSCPIREEDYDICFDDPVSSKINTPSSNNFFSLLFDEIKNVLVGFFTNLNKSIAQNDPVYLSDYLGIENVCARSSRPSLSCSGYSNNFPNCVKVSTTQTFNSCDASKNAEIASRFELLEKLEHSRKKLTGCVKGYGAGYKDNPTEVVEVISCMEGVTEPGVLMLPEFPYPSKAKEKVPYNNCYPLNASRLTEDQRSQCFYNPLREGNASNPGCLMITLEYMDNYYCCN